MQGLVVFAILTIVLAACSRGGSGNGDPTVTPMPMPTRAVTPTMTAATPVTSPMASPIASPVAAPSGSPTALTASASTITREEFRQQIAAAFPMEPVGSEGGQVILGGSGDISTTNPMLASDSTSINVLGQVFEPLLGASPIDGRPVPALADSWDVSPDGLTYTFRINQRAKWHDGVDVTAEDVKFSFDAILDPNLSSPYRTQVREVIASYRVVDADTFEITASDRFVTFLYYAPGSVFIMPKHLWESVGSERWSFDPGSTGQDPARVIGSGPFKFGSWNQGESVTLVRNDAYYDVVPHISEFKLLVQNESDVAVRTLEAGETDIVEILPAPQTQQVADAPNLEVAVYDLYSVTYYMTNLDGARSPALADPVVRRAMYQAFDREQITAQIFAGFGKAAVGTQPPPSPAYAPDQLSPYPFDVEGSKRLLADAGWADSNDDGTLDRDGEELKFSLLFVGGDATVEGTMAYLQESWAGIGIEVELENIDGNVLLQRLQERDFDLAVLAPSFAFDGSQSIFFTCDAIEDGFNFMGYCNPEYDQLDDAQLREFDAAKRRELLIQQTELIWTDLPVSPIRFGVARTGYNARLHNFYPNSYGFLWSLPYVWVEAS